MSIEMGPLDRKDNYDAEVVSAAIKHGIDPDLAVAVHRQEYNPRQWISSAEARGQMQLMPGTAKDLGVNPDDTLGNIDGGVRYLKQMLQMFNGNERLALAAYNVGPGKVQQTGGVPSAAVRYVLDVQSRANKFRKAGGVVKPVDMGSLGEGGPTVVGVGSPAFDMTKAVDMGSLDEPQAPIIKPKTTALDKIKQGIDSLTAKLPTYPEIELAQGGNIPNLAGQQPSGVEGADTPQMLERLRAGQSEMGGGVENLQQHPAGTQAQMIPVQVQPERTIQPVGMEDDPLQYQPPQGGGGGVPGDTRTIGEAVSRSIRKVGPNLIQQGAGTIAAVAEALHALGKGEMLSNVKTEDNPDAIFKVLSRDASAIAVEAEKEVQKISKEANYGKLWDNPALLKSAPWWIENIIDTSVSMVPTMAAGILKGPIAGGLVGGGMEGSSFYAQLISGSESEAPLDPKTAAMAATAYGITSAILNSLGLESILGTSTKGFFKKAAIGAIGEGITEYAEEPAQAAWESLARGESPEQAGKRVVESLKNIETGLFGALGGGAMSGAVHVMGEGQPEDFDAKRFADSGRESLNMMGVGRSEAQPPKKATTTIVTPEKGVQEVPVQPGAEMPIAPVTPWREAPTPEVPMTEVLTGEQVQSRIDDGSNLIEQLRTYPGGDNSPTKIGMYQELGRFAVPGIRSQDAEEAGRLYERVYRGELQVDEWRDFIDDLKASNKILKPKKETTNVEKTEAETLLEEKPSTIPTIPEHVPTPEVQREGQNTKPEYEGTATIQESPPETTPIMGDPSRLNTRQTVDGVDYELWDGEKASYVRTFDSDAKEVVEIRRYSRRTDAKKYFHDTLARVTSGEVEKKEPENPPDQHVPIGINADGQQVYEDADGNRFLSDGKVRQAAPRGIGPRGEKHSPYSVDELYGQGQTEYLTKNELAEREAKEEKPVEKPASPTPEQQTPSSLSDYGLKVTKGRTKNGNAVWEVSGNTKEHSAAIKAAGGRWYGPKKIWGFFVEKDPSEKILAKLSPIDKKDLESPAVQTIEPTIEPKEQEEKPISIEEKKEESAIEGSSIQRNNWDSDLEHGARVLFTTKQTGSTPIDGTVTKVYEGGQRYTVQSDGGRQYEVIARKEGSRIKLSDKPKSVVEEEPKEPTKRKFNIGDKVVPIRDKDILKPGTVAHVHADGYIRLEGQGKHWNPEDYELDTSEAKPLEKSPKEPYPIDKEKAPSPKEESHADTTSARQPETGDQGLAGDLPTERLQPNEESGDTGSIREGDGRPDVGGVSGDEQRDQQSGGGENPGNRRGVDSVPDPDTGSVGEDLSPASSGTGKRTRPVKKGQDYSVPPGGLKREGTWPETARRNVDIIELALKIESENRPATPEEQELLSKYVGFGAGEIRNKLFPAGYTRRGERQQPLSQIWPNYHIYEKSWQELAERLSKLPEQWQKTILQSTQYAHYTSENVTRQMWEAAKHLGFTGGRVLEPGMGIGNFFMTMPEGLRKVSTFTGVEFDGPTALIAKLLLPKQQVLHDDYTKRKLPENFFDFAIGNPPFASIPITNDPKYAKYEFSLHDYFFAKTVDLVRPGGMVMFITSRHTMDRKGDKARKYLNERADLVGAIRLPQMAFQDNAGTSVVTDVMFFRKRKEGEEPAGVAWSNQVEIDTKDGPVSINEYYAAHPEMILGQVRKTGNQDDLGRRIGGERGYDQPTVVSYYENYEELDAAFADAVKRLPGNVFSITSKDVESIKRETEAIEFNPKVRREGALYLDDKGKVRRVQGGVGVAFFEAAKIPEAKREWFKDFVGLKDAVNTCRYDQYNDGPWEASLKAVQGAYDKFRKKHGPILDFSTRTTIKKDEDGNEYEIQSRTYKNEKFWREDYDSSIVTQLEKITEEGEIVKSAFLEGRTIGKPVTAEVKTIHDAMAVSLDAIGKLDLNDIATRMGISEQEAIETLDDLIFKQPSGEWVLSDEYLSGDVVKKLEEAKVAADLDSSLRRNVEALEKVQPQPLGHSQIRVLLGSGWIPDRYVTEFATEVLGAGKVSYDKKTETWTVEGGNKRSERALGKEYGTAHRSPSELLEAVLNGRQIVVKIPVDDGHGGTKMVTGPKETEEANDVARKMKEKFSTWIWTDSSRTGDLLDIYNRTKNNIAPRRFNGSHLTLPGVSLKYKLHEHQKRAIWRIIQTGNTYLGHSVGAGKTIEMIAAGMEMKRLGLVNRPWYVVPNHMLEQFANEFMDLYPLANVMMADKEAFHKDKRKDFIAQATLNAPDAVIITHSAFERIGVKEESVAPIRKKLVDELEEALTDTEDSDRIRRSALQRQIEIVERRFDSITGSDKKDVTITFEETGCDFLFVDEAHNYRKLDFHTNRKIKGIDPNGARKSMDMYVKTKFLEDNKAKGRTHVFASGTPLTNTVGEMYTLMRFFIEDQMQEEGMATFDGWAGTFGDSKVALEPNAAGNYENVERFSTFVNIPELMSRVRSFMDVLTSDQLGSIVKRPDVESGGPEIVVVPSTPEQTAYREGPLSNRVAVSKAWKPSFQQRNNPDPMIAIISEGRKASIDPRFFDPTISEDTPSKLNKMADEIIEEYKRTKDYSFVGANGKPESKKGGVQIVFYNLGFGEQMRKKNAFDARDAVTKRLIAGGIKREEIAWFGDADTDAKKERIFKEARAGNIRVVIGSAKKMGTGVNIQKRLTAMHYLDPPWYPADFEQPQGRIIRQGNQNEWVRIKLYATKGSYDETMWAMVARKQKQIDQAFSGDASVRNLEDISEASHYEMASALASGDQRVIQLAGLNQEIDRFDRLAAAHQEAQRRIGSEIDHIEKWQLPSANERLQKLQEAEKAIGGSYASYNSGSVGEKSFDQKQKEEFGDAIKVAYNKAVTDHAATLKKNSKSGWNVVGTIGKLNGKFDLRVNVRNQGGSVESAELELGAGPLWFEVLSGKSFDDTVSAGGLVTKAVNILNRIDRDIREKKETIEEHETELRRLKKSFGAPFEYENQRAEKIVEKNRLEAELVASGVTTTPGTVTDDRPQDVIASVEDIESELGQEVAEAMGEVSPPVGLSIRTIGKPSERRATDPETNTSPGGTGFPPQTAQAAQAPGDKFSFSDKSVEDEFQRYKGVPSETIINKIGEWYGALVNRATRVYETLPETSQFAPLQNALLKLGKQKTVASDRTLRAIQGIRHGLSKYENDVFERKVILDDLQYTADEGKTLPHPFTPETVAAELERLEAEIERHPNIKEAMAKRKTMWDAIKNDYVKAQKAIGHNVDKKFTNPSYFRHQVLEYAGIRPPVGTGGKLKTPSSRGYLKQREGSEKPINYDYLQAEHEIMAQMIFDIEIAKTIKTVDEEYNVLGQLKIAAMEANDASIMPFFKAMADEVNAQKGPQATPATAESVYRQMLNKKQAIGFQKLGKLASEGELPDTPSGKYSGVIEALAENYEKIQALKDEYGDEYNSSMNPRLSDKASRRLFDYMAWILRERGGEPGSGPAAMIFKGIREKKETIKSVLGDRHATWKDMIPDGYTTWQPREGQIFYLSDSIPARIADELLAGKLEELGIKKDDLRKIMAVGGRRREFVVPQEVADTLDNLFKPYSDNMIAKVARGITRPWKQWQLISPRRYGRYNIRNLTGDAEAVFVGCPAVFKKMPEAFSELYATMFHDKPMTDNMKDWFERGGMESTLQFQEMEDLHNLKMFEKFYDQKTGALNLPKNLWQRYWRFARLSTDFREAVLRYAAYLHFSEEIANSKDGLPKNYGASRADYIKALPREDRAFWLSNDLLGAYDRVSALGRDVRDFAIPFWSWKEVNFKRYIQLFKNAANDGKLTEHLGRRFVGMAARSPFIAMRVGKFVLMASAFWAMLQAYNNLMFPDEEDDLPENIKNRPHIILGRDEDGKISYFNRVGMLGDFLEWFGLDAFPKHVNDWTSGRKDLKQIAFSMAKSPVNVLVQGANWLPKMIGEVATRRSLFPDFSRPGTIRDRGLYIARGFGLENEYIAINGLPSKGYTQSLSTLLQYKIDADEGAYRDVQDMKRDFLLKMGRESEGFWLTPKGQILYNLKLSIRYKDKVAAAKYITDYIIESVKGGQDSDKKIDAGMTASLKAMDPLSGMNKEVKEMFLGSLDQEDVARVRKAERFYQTVLLNPEK